MIEEGQIVLFRFPQTDLSTGKLRPALVVRKIPGPYDDWLICMISSKVERAVDGFDEVITHSDSEFTGSGLKSESVIRVSRLAAVERSILVGTIGHIGPGRLSRIRNILSDWLRST